MNPRPKHILVIRMSAMGDVAMTIPVLRVLIQTYSELRITVLTRKLFAPFFEGMERVQLFIPDLKGKHRGLLGLYRLANELAQLDIDAVADLHDVLRSQILRWLLQKKSIPYFKIDKGREEKKALTRPKDKVFKQLKSTHQRYAQVFENFEYPIDLGQHKFPKKRAISEKTKALIELLNSSINWSQPIVGIAPFAKHAGKAYPIDLMEEVIAELSNLRINIFLFGGGEEETKILQSIDNQYSNVINMAQKIGLDQELRLIGQSQLMVSMDSANMHMASMCGTRVLSLWGATHPTLGFYGFGQNPKDAMTPDRDKYPGLPSSVYGQKVLEGYEDSMRSLSPESITDRIKNILLEDR